MIESPWSSDTEWWKKDSKLIQLQESPIVLPHAESLIKDIKIMEGIFSILGPRQVGKSTLLRLIIKKTLKTISPQNIFLLEGDVCETWKDLLSALEGILHTPTSSLRIILIDEITSIDQWPRAIKFLADKGFLKHVCLIFTGSSSATIKDSGELFPGRRGKNSKTNFELYPVSYRDVSSHLSLEEYFWTGGFPWAINEYLRLKTVPDYVCEIYWSWLKGEFLKRGKSEHILQRILHTIAQRGHTGFSQNSLAQNVGLTSNDTARQYLELLQNSYAIHEIPWVDVSSGDISLKKNRKYYPIDPLLFHMFQHPSFNPAISPESHVDAETSGYVAEVIVCQELIKKGQRPGYWLGKKEIDFVLDSSPTHIEVKYQNRVSASEFSWFEKYASSKKELTVLTKNDRFLSGKIRGIPLKEWLLS